MDRLRESLRGCLGRLKKSKTSRPDTSSSSAPQQPKTPPSPTIRTDDIAPQLPPLQTSPRSITISDKPLPPTHPLATGKHEQPQITVPESAAVAQLEPDGPFTSVVAKGQSAGEKRVEEQKQEPSQIGQNAAAASITGADSKQGISATGEAQDQEEDCPPTPPPKTDSFEPLKSDKLRSLHGTDPNIQQPSTTAVSDTRTDETPTTQSDNLTSTTAHPQQKENFSPNTLPSEDSIPSTNIPTSTQSQPQENIVPYRPTSAEEKMALKDEPIPPIPTKPFAPGMSATSGPLEDFFLEGGEVHGD